MAQQSNLSVALRVNIPFTGKLNKILQDRKQRAKTQRDLRYRWIGKVRVAKQHPTTKIIKGAFSTVKRQLGNAVQNHKVNHEIRQLFDLLPYHLMPEKGRDVEVITTYDGQPFIYIHHMQGFKEEWFINLLEELDNRGFILRKVETNATEYGGSKTYRLQRGKSEKITLVAHLAHKPENCEMVKIGEKIVPEYDLVCKDND